MKNILLVLCLLLGVTSVTAQSLTPRLTLTADSEGAWFSLRQDSVGQWSNLNLEGAHKKLRLGSGHDAWRIRARPKLRKMVAKDPAGQKTVLDITPTKKTDDAPRHYVVDSVDTEEAMRLFYQMDAWQTFRQPDQYGLLWSTPEWICIQDLNSPEIKLMYISAQDGKFSRTSRGDLVHKNLAGFVDVVPVHSGSGDLLSCQFQALSLMDSSAYHHFPFREGGYTITGMEEAPTLVELPYHPGATPKMLRYQQVTADGGVIKTTVFSSWKNQEQMERLQSGDILRYINLDMFMQE